MGGGSWTTSSFVNYSNNASRIVSTDGIIDSSYGAQDLFKSYSLQKELNPYDVMRECCDTDEHPNTIPVILALDVTGSMGEGSAEVAKRLNEVMTELYKRVTDVEFMIMAIGDLAYDSAPIQASQFESDIRIAEQLDKVYFEGGGGGNRYESYTAAWYFGLNHTKLDCWNRGKKGIIITMGDEPINPYLPYNQLNAVIGDKLQGDVETDELYKEVVSKFDVYHIAVDDISTSYKRYKEDIKESFGKYLDSQHLFVVTLDNISKTIVDIVSGSSTSSSDSNKVKLNNGEISW